MLTKWLHNKDWMPVSATCMTAVLRHAAANRHTVTVSQPLTCSGMTVVVLTINIKKFTK
nr:WPE palindromic element domain-containing protein [Wolbachia endosymbiont of Psylliodes chrysocephala]